MEDWVVWAVVGVVAVVAVGIGALLWAIQQANAATAQVRVRRKALPDGREVFAVNDHEPGFLFHEIFLQKVYGRRT
jgi:hypothetical protein